MAVVAAIEAAGTKNGTKVVSKAHVHLDAHRVHNVTVAKKYGGECRTQRLGQRRQLERLCVENATTEH